MDRDRFCLLISRVMTDTLNTKININDVSEQLLLMEMGKEPTSLVIGAFIKKFSIDEIKR